MVFERKPRFILRSENVVKCEVLIVCPRVEKFAAPGGSDFGAVRIQHGHRIRMQIGAGRRAVRKEQTQQIAQSLFALQAERVVAGSLRMKEGCIGGKTAPVVKRVAVERPFAEPVVVPVADRQIVPFVVGLVSVETLQNCGVFLCLFKQRRIPFNEVVIRGKNRQRGSDDRLFESNFMRRIENSVCADVFNMRPDESG